VSYSIAKSMKDNLPNFYEKSRVVSELMEKEAAELYKISTDIEDLTNQFFVDTATWGLSYWEETVGITPNMSIPYEDRRGAVKAKLRGKGTVTVPMIKQVAESFVFGLVDVSESPATNEINIKFVDTRGIPSNLDLIKEALIRVIPAHLRLAFLFTFITWSELEIRTWDEIESQNGGVGLTWDELEIWK